MNYAEHYNRLITRASGRVLTGYKERHHVRPRCMGGDNAPDNLVDLTAEEHYVAHQLLVKMYPTVRGLVIAAIRMSKQCTGNKAYGWLRRRAANIQRNLGPDHWKEKVSKMRSINIGNKYCLGRIRPKETRKKQSNTIRSNPGLYAEHVKRLNENRHKIYTPERNAKIWETRRKNGNATHTEAAKEKIRSARARQVISQETRLKMSATQHLRWKKIKSESNLPVELVRWEPSAERLIP